MEPLTLKNSHGL
ncbi:Protein CBG25523 [Caenorhabditis briggsae]|uniref:Protein CBG25523 n=1 Tax=Caenorhabditis briggsae TaxID=6238 RepID=B6IFP8_CAEBR|nr:Protein CBG25523 [Caenorhabditis briggsae]CAR98728.1 Protein CBG25523 [Caenorhabditis briggsae]